jgi:hypothetical protein
MAQSIAAFQFLPDHSAILTALYSTLGLLSAYEYNGDEQVGRLKFRYKTAPTGSALSSL